MLPFRRKIATAAQSAVGNPISAGLLLSRIPVVTPELNKIESQYYDYQSELKKRLMWTFPHYFYFRRGTLAERRFLMAQKGPISKQPGVWFPKGTPDVKHNRERSQKQEIALPRESNEGSELTQKGSDISRPVVPNARITEADKTGDETSLERKLDRTLYLMVKAQDGSWNFPSFPAYDKPLHISAEEGLRSLGGGSIKTWTVSNTPAAALEIENGGHQFIIKSHILAGEFKLQNKQDFVEYAWLTKEEIQDRVEATYFKSTGFLLADN